MPQDVRPSSICKACARESHPPSQILRSQRETPWQLGASLRHRPSWISEGSLQGGLKQKGHRQGNRVTPSGHVPLSSKAHGDSPSSCIRKKKTVKSMATQSSEWVRSNFGSSHFFAQGPIFCQSKQQLSSPLQEESSVRTPGNSLQACPLNSCRPSMPDAQTRSSAPFA